MATKSKRATSKKWAPKPQYPSVANRPKVSVSNRAAFSFDKLSALPATEAEQQQWLKNLRKFG